MYIRDKHLSFKNTTIPRILYSIVAAHDVSKTIFLQSDKVVCWAQ